MKSIWKIAMPVTAAIAGSVAYGFPPEPQPAPAKVLVATAMSGGSFLGIGVSEIDADRAKALNLREERGVEITRVEEDSPASRAGLKTGDVVLEYGGQRVEGTEQFVRLVHETPVGREVKVSISRNGSQQTVVAKTGARKLEAAKSWTLRSGDAFPIEMPEIRMQDIPKAFMGWRSTVLGIEGESVDSQLAQYFGVKEGVLIRSVVKGSAAEKAGLRAGDVITKVDSTSVSNVREITGALRSAGSRKAVTVTLTRERKEQSINVNLDEDKQNGDISPSRPRAVRVHVAEK
jgi:serine protease Do